MSKIDHIENRENSWFVHLTDGSVDVQRKHEYTASDTPMTHREDLLCMLCKKIEDLMTGAGR